VDHAGAVDASHVELVDEIETLGPADALSLAVLTVLAIFGTLLALAATLSAPTLLTWIECALVGYG